ncbi:hypothetical protein TSUD_286840 [Trifolium subterraneum]|uniref:Reverse transcriptase domain-containing protein n=1 Tax=Trifolium subterraneum TaxID=3900 RepID=A0A2Z6LQF8_TRISU|nr:hypothetical protein TSUD_286840 [Trifolium subterraneum]
MKRLKADLKTWNREVFGIMDLNIGNTAKDLNEVEELIAKGDNHPLFANSKELSKKFWEQLHCKESIRKKKSRSKWIQEGDSNTSFFHAAIKGRRRSNRIVKLKKGNVWLQGVDEIKQEAKEHVSQQFSEEWPSRPCLQGIDFNMLSVDDNAYLLEAFSEEEVRETIWSCDGNKSSGPDGFNINFLTESFLTLIPKKDHPQGSI